MLLGVVLHTSLIYGPSIKEFWNVQDLYTNNIIFDIAALFIHLFRIPVFFVLAGFFSALLSYQKGKIPMLINRFKRILLPALCFNFLLWPLMALSHWFAVSKMYPTQDIFSVLGYKNELWTFLFPANSFNLWFLYYYFYLAVLTGITQRYLVISQQLINRIIDFIIPICKILILRIILFSLPIFLLLIFFNIEWIETPPQLLIDVPSFILYAIYYIMGWVLFTKKQLFYYLSDRAVWILMIGLLLFLAKLLTINDAHFYLSACINASFSMSMVLGLIGMAYKSITYYNRYIRYLSDASYWIYLIHVPILITLSGILYNINLNVFVKFSLVLIGTYSIALLSYQLVVRSSFIGQFLNGRRVIRPNHKLNNST